MTQQLALPECKELNLSPIQIEELIEATWKEMEITKNYITYKQCWDRIDYLRSLKYKSK